MQRIPSVILIWTIVWFGSASARAADDNSQGGAKVPDAQMKAVLDELAALNPKPIETLSPEEARKQPTPADAVKKVLEKQNKPTDPEAVGNVDDKTIPGTSYFQKLWTAATSLSGDSVSIDVHDAVDQVFQFLTPVQFSPA